MTTTEPPRWHHRFANYRRAFLSLGDALDGRELTQLEREGAIRRFKYTMELAWKVMKDYLEAQNVVLPQVTPRAVMRAAFEAQLIGDGEAWMDALDDRNKMSHTYNFVRFEEVLDRVRRRYLAAMDELHMRLFDELEGQAPAPRTTAYRPDQAVQHVQRCRLDAVAKGELPAPREAVHRGHEPKG